MNMHAVIPEIDVFLNIFVISSVEPILTVGSNQLVCKERLRV